MSYRILATARSFCTECGKHKRVLQEAGCEVIEAAQAHPLKASELRELITDMDAVIVGLDEVTEAVVSAAPRLRVISKHGVGVDNIDLEAATRRGIVVTNTPGANHIAVAELALGLMLALARRIPQHTAALRAGSWKRVVGTELASKTLGIVGLGRVGIAVAQRARALDMHILYCDVIRHEDLEVRGWLEYAALDALLATSDFVSLHCPLTSELQGVIGEAQLRAMKPSAFLINTARGGLVDEVALAKALREGWIAGAASDVFVHEPPSGSALLTLDHFIAVPHIGAATHEAVQRMALMAAENVLLVLRGERAQFAVNPRVYSSSI